MVLSKEIMEILVCPKCKGDLELEAGEEGLVCYACELKYKIEDDIPNMLIDQATPLKK